MSWLPTSIVLQTEVVSLTLTLPTMDGVDVGTLSRFAVVIGAGVVPMLLASKVRRHMMIRQQQDDKIEEITSASSSAEKAAAGLPSMPCLPGPLVLLCVHEALAHASFFLTGSSLLGEQMKIPQTVVLYYLCPYFFSSARTGGYALPPRLECAPFPGHPPSLFLSLSLSLSLSLGGGGGGDQPSFSSFIIYFADVR